VTDPAVPGPAVPGPTTPALSRPAFAHASEAELARILDFYQVRWSYEPDTFPIGWTLDGEVVESFSPDFYLPDLELYVELTTLKQKLVRRKNRKLRRLRELYPDVRIKLFYARDFRMLMLKFGRMALIDDLTGTTGQATPPRSHAPVPALVADAGAGSGSGAGAGSGVLEAAAIAEVAAADAGPAAPDDTATPGLAGDSAPEPPEARRRRRGRRRRRHADAAQPDQAASAGSAADGPDAA
jgi:hypoxanthine phosphoribosyltransferase